MGGLWADDTELFAAMQRELYTAVVGDILDTLGRRRQFLPPQIRPLTPEMVVAGRAVPVIEEDVDRDPDPPFGIMLEALDSLRRHDIYFASGVEPRYALWGELMSVAARTRGAAGAVLAGYARDTKSIVQMQFPVFCWGSYALDQRGRGIVVAHHVEVKVGGVTVRPGDILFGDVDGVLVVPRELETEVIERALEKARTENTARKELSAGASAVEVFRTHKVL
jgi:4-hydroxy-4-methyl-2-oxoglutarate aldolase